MFTQKSLLGFSLASLALAQTSTVVSTTTCNGLNYTYESLAGYGFIASDAVDKYGDTIGGIGSSIAVDKKSWKRGRNGVYTGILYGLPDRGWNTQGTLNFQNRIHKFGITFTPNDSATVDNPSPPNLVFNYLDTILLNDPTNTPVTGLDGGITGPYLTFDSTGEVPSTTYTGDGYGGDGDGGTRVVVDSEGLVLKGGNYWVSDEYGDYIYEFNSAGTMLRAIRPPPAFIPIRNSNESFSANSPPLYNPALVPSPGSPTTGRSNNQGLEGLTINPAGTRLYALTQSALIQDGGTSNKLSRNARFLIYDIRPRFPTPQLIGEYVVQLNKVDYPLNSATVNTARQSEIHYISPTQFFVLARDSGAGRGQNSTQSLYRHIDVFDISNATNIVGLSDDQGDSIAPGGALLANTTAATYCSFLDFNNNDQLERFGVHNGGDPDEGLLNEKWESIAVLPVRRGRPGRAVNDEYYVISLSDNDFITQNGHLNFGQFNYSDASGYNLDNQALVFKVQLPTASKPLFG